MTLISQNEYAKQRGVSREAVRQHVASGKITLIDGKIDPVVADAQWAANVRNPKPFTQPKAADPLPDSAIPQTVYDLHLARAKRETHEANIAEMKERQYAGELVELQAVEKANADIFVQTRNALERIPDKLAERLAAESDPFACRELLTTEIEQTLTDLATALATLADQLGSSDDD